MNVQRRKTIAAQMAILEGVATELRSVLEEEETALENTPDAFCDRQDSLHESIDTLEDAATEAENVIDILRPISGS